MEEFKQSGDQEKAARPLKRQGQPEHSLISSLKRIPEVRSLPPFSSVSTAEGLIKIASLRHLHCLAVL
ncbi:MULTISPECIES: hypothetical protein [unclassified Holdemania]|uniref:hypothetical protein n=1 Tax=unclassified Holdemania TaxID=2637685 RepID=UPI000A673770|nr:MULTISPECIES: hypothetical protein [unclassified Holdemania]